MFSFLSKRLSGIRTPSILQVEHTECGVVSLAIVCGYYRKWFSIEFLRDACGNSRDGSNAMNLIKFARDQGFDASGYSLELEELKELKSFPMVIHWKFNHFVVLERIKKRYWINDPAAGRMVLDEREVDECFTGVVLTFEPNKDFKPSGRPPSWARSFCVMRVKSKWGCFLAATLGLALVIPGALLPILSIVFLLIMYSYKVSGLVTNSSGQCGSASCVAIFTKLSAADNHDGIPN